MILFKHLCRRVAPGLGLGLVLVLLSGCGSGGAGAPVKGTVTFDGETVDGGAIVFVPEGEKRPSSGGPIVAGHYSLEGDKAPVPGSYRIEITWKKPTGKMIPTPGDPGNEMEETIQVIPARYNLKSKERVVVKPGQNTFDFALTKDP
jgi:hypothetical protein